MICAHPDRDAIEGDFVRWRSPIKIAEDYPIANRSSIYRHAHATGLFDRRKQEVARVMEQYLELVDHYPAEQFDTVTRAVRGYSHLGDDGRWFEPPRTHFILTSPAWPPQATDPSPLPSHLGTKNGNSNIPESDTESNS